MSIGPIYTFMKQFKFIVLLDIQGDLAGSVSDYSYITWKLKYALGCSKRCWTDYYCADCLLCNTELII